VLSDLKEFVRQGEVLILYKKTGSLKTVDIILGASKLPLLNREEIEFILYAKVTEQSLGEIAKAIHMVRTLLVLLPPDGISEDRILSIIDCARIARTRKGFTSDIMLLKKIEEMVCLYKR